MNDITGDVATGATSPPSTRQASSAVTQDIRGEARIVDRAFGIGACALAEAVAMIGERLEIQPA